MKNTKGIIFDAYGTLFDVNSAAEKCKGKIGDKWEDFANYWRTTQLEYTWLRSLMNRHKDFWKITEDSLDKSMKFFKIDNSMRNDLLDLYKVLSPFSEVKETLEEEKTQAIEEAKEDMVDKVDSYLNYVTEEWKKENQLAIERGLKGEIAEDFISGLKQLFEDHYIDVPDEKYNILEAQEKEIEDLKGKLNEKIEEDKNSKSIFFIPCLESISTQTIFRFLLEIKY